MHFSFQAKTKLALLLLCAVCSSQAFGMNWLFGRCYKHKTTIKQKKLKISSLSVQHHKELFTLLYNLLKMMPPELIDIITDYVSHELQCRCVRTYSDTSEPTCMTMLSDNRFVTGHNDGTIQRWDKEAKTISDYNRGELAFISTLTQLRDKRLAVGGKTGRTPTTQIAAIELWNIESETPTPRTIPVRDCSMPLILIEHEQDKLIIIIEDALVILNLKTAVPEKTIIRGPRSLNNAIKLISGHVLIATNEGMEWWDIDKSMLVKETRVIPNPSSLAELPNGNLIVNSLEKILMVNPLNNKIKELGSHENIINAILIHSSELIVSADRAHTIKLWDPATGECKGEMKQKHARGFNHLLELCNGCLASLALKDLCIQAISQKSETKNTVRIWQ